MFIFWGGETFSLTRRYQLQRIYRQHLNDAQHQRQMRLPATHIVLSNWASKASLLGPTYLNCLVLLHKSRLKSAKTNLKVLWSPVLPWLFDWAFQLRDIQEMVSVCWIHMLGPFNLLCNLPTRSCLAFVPSSS